MQRQRHSLADIDIPFIDIYVPKTPIQMDQGLRNDNRNSSISKQIQDSQRRQNIQLQLIQEVNQQRRKQSKSMYQNAPPDISSLLLESTASANDQIPLEDENQNLTRARKVPVFKTVNRSVAGIEVKQFDHLTSSKKNHQDIQDLQQENLQEQRCEILDSENLSNDDSKQQKSPDILKEPKERQIKYLGLIIEKDTEQVVLISNSREELLMQDQDGIKRQYVPTRDKYIQVVQHCRNLSLDLFEKQGQPDFQRTANRLAKISDYLQQNDSIDHTGSFLNETDQDEV